MYGSPQVSLLHLFEILLSTKDLLSLNYAYGTFLESLMPKKFHIEDLSMYIDS